MDFATYLEQWLTEQRFSQGRLAQAAGVSQGLISKWVHPDPERRSVPSPRNLVKLAPILGVPYRDLLQLTGHLEPDGPDEDVDPDLTSSRAKQTSAVLIGLLVRSRSVHRDVWVDALYAYRRRDGQRFRP